MDEPAAVAEARRVMMHWLGAPEARRAAAAELRRYGLDVYDPVDLVNDVAVSVLQADFDEPVDNPVGYARRALTNRARDLLRHEKVERGRVAPHPADDGDEGGHTDPLLRLEDPGAPDPLGVVAAQAAESDLRWHLQRSLVGTKAWMVAAALTTLTLRLHDDVAVPDGAPVPEVGHRDKADRWAALWLAGEDDAFPDPASGRGETDAMRQARSRKLRAVDALLRAVAADVLGQRGGGPDA